MPDSPSPGIRKGWKSPTTLYQAALHYPLSSAALLFGKHQDFRSDFLPLRQLRRNYPAFERYGRNVKA